MMTKEKLDELREQAEDREAIADSLQRDADDALTEAETAWDAFYRAQEELQ